MRYMVWESPTSGEFIFADKVVVGKEAIYFIKEHRTWEETIKFYLRKEFEKHNELPKGYITLND